MSISRPKRVSPVFLSGLLAISVNTVLLKIAPVLGIKAESGGLLKLVFKILPASSAYPFLHTVSFWILFHLLTGVALVVFYYLVFTPLHISKWLKGILFSFVPWCINGLVVLPLLGQGIMGMQQLTVSGIVYFFIANLVFALLLAALAEK